MSSSTSSTNRPDSIVAVGALPEGHWGVRILRRLERFLYRNSDAIVIVSEAFRPEIVLRGGRTEKIHVVTNGADVGLFRPPADNEKLKRSFGLEGKFVASFAGTLGMAHGLDTVLQAAARLSSSTDIVFWLVGEGARKEELKRAAEARGLTNVLFQGQVPRERVPDVLGASDVSLVLLRKTDLFRTVIPSKMFEAMAVARPIILGVDGQARKIVEEAGAGVVIEPESSGELAEAVLRLKRDRPLAERLGKSGLAYVRRYHSHDALARRYLEILESVSRGVA